MSGNMGGGSLSAGIQSGTHFGDEFHALAHLARESLLDILVRDAVEDPGIMLHEGVQVTHSLGRHVVIDISLGGGDIEIKL